MYNGSRAIVISSGIASSIIVILIFAIPSFIIHNQFTVLGTEGDVKSLYFVNGSTTVTLMAGQSAPPIEVAYIEPCAYVMATIQKPGDLAPKETIMLHTGQTVQTCAYKITLSSISLVMATFRIDLLGKCS